MNYGFAFFPGQGAQAPGMGKDLYENSQAAKLVFEEASEGAGLDVAKLCFESDKATLSRTENSQIAIFTHSMAAWAALKEAGVEFKARQASRSVNTPHWRLQALFPSQTA